MSVVFLGDVAHPFKHSPTWAVDNPPWADDAIVSLNLEGPIVSDPPPGRVIYNHQSVLPTIQSLGTVVANFANNHICDTVDGLANSIGECASAGIRTVGGGLTLQHASEPTVVEQSGTQMVFLAFGWPTIECVPADPTSSGVNPLEPRAVLRQIHSARAMHPKSTIYVQFHWNYELELYPQPAHRQLAQAAIDAGADAIVGHHPHIVGGFERWRGKPIAYSIGNCWFPQHVFWRGALSHGEQATLQLSLEICSPSVARAHWFRYEPTDHTLHYIESESADGSARLRERTPYSSLDHNQYVRWFQASRVKRRVLPIYRDYRSTIGNRLRDQFVAMRQVGVNAIKQASRRAAN